MGKALYRKYRSRALSEIVGQEHVTTALENALKNDRIGHAYLFTGPRGVGKTSIARILAHEVNQLPYDEETPHLDIIEIDAASNRRIDEIRTLRERVHNAPTSAKYKVYIIDEVHMLTKEAFNALLKTLEEPPAHVIFILATTEVHKLPETIISRTQRYTFKPAEKSSAISHLKSIAKSEKLDITDEALELLAIHGKGSFRDSISLLDQIGNTNEKITIEDVRRSLGIAPEDSLTRVIDAIVNGTAHTLLSELAVLHEQGYQAPQIARQLSALLRNQLLQGEAILDGATYSRLSQQLIDVPAAHDPYALLEIVLLEPILKRTGLVEAPQLKQEKPVAMPKKTTKPPAPTQTKDDNPIIKQAEEKPKDMAKKVDVPSQITNAGHTILDEDSWQQVLQALKQSHNTLYGIARMAVPMFEEGKLTLSFAFPFHQKRFNEAKNTKILTKIIQDQTGNAIAIECIVEKKQSTPSKSNPKKATTEKSEPTAPLDTISNIFGGGEILD